VVDLALSARVALVKALKADATLTALVPTARIYGPEPPDKPQWPWAYVQTPLESPARATCLNGASLSVTVHGFAKGPGDDAASAIGNAIKRALDDLSIPLDECTVDVQWQQNQIIRDSAEASAYHCICRFNVEVGA
jgi:hypothetical protein